MRQLNFVVIFFVSLLLVLFALQNTAPVSIQLFQGVKVEAPLAVELIIATGLGAVAAWIFSVWSGIQRSVDQRGAKEQIQTLQQEVTSLSTEIEQRKRLASASAIDVEVQDETKESASPK